MGWVGAFLLAPLRAAGAPVGVYVGLAFAYLTVLLVGVLMLVVTIRTTVEGGVLRLALWPIWRVRMPVTDLQVSETTATPAQWGGICLRRGYGAARRVQRALLLSPGTAVLIRDKRTGMQYTVRTDRRAELCRALSAPVLT